MGKQGRALLHGSTEGLTCQSARGTSSSSACEALYASREGKSRMILQQLYQFATAENKMTWLVEGLIPRGNWTYLVGPPGSGKSMFMLQLINALQEGREFLGFATTKANCLYLQSDAAEGEWQAQVQLIAPGSAAWTLYNVPKGALSDRASCEAIKAIIWGVHKDNQVPFDFVVFDALRSLTLEETAVSYSRALTTLHSLCSWAIGDMKKETTFLLIHHPTMGRGVRGVNAGAGYGGLASDCSVMLTLAGKMLAIEKGRVLKNRHIELERDEYGLWFDPSSRRETSVDRSLPFLGASEETLLAEFPAFAAPLKIEGKANGMKHA